MSGGRYDVALEVLGVLRLADGRPWVRAAVQFQRSDAEAIFDLDGPRFHFLTRPRGGSKTTDLGAVSMAVLLAQAPRGAPCYAVAADADQAALLVDAIRGFVLRQPTLGELLRVDTRRVTAQQTVATLDVVPADAASAFGLIPYLTVVDELAQWPSTANARGVWDAMVSALPKQPDARLVVLTSAGDPAHWSHKVLAQARRSDRWRVNEVDGPLPWISEEELGEQRALLTESQFVRLHLNRWTAPEDRLVRPEDLAACVVLDGPQEARAGVRYRIGVDVGLRNDRTAIAVAHAEPAAEVEADGSGRRPQRVVLDTLLVLAGSRTSEVRLADVEQAIVETWTAYGCPKVRLDPWQAIGLRQRLEGRGVAAEEFTFSAQSVGRLASTLHLLLRDRLLALPDDEALLDELAHVRLRETSPGVVRMDHDSGRRDDRAIALALAASALVEEGDWRPARGSSPAGLRLGRGAARARGTPGRSGAGDGSGRSRGAAVLVPKGAPGAGNAMRRRLPKIAGRK